MSGAGRISSSPSGGDPATQPKFFPGVGNENREVEGIELGHAAADAAVEPVPVVPNTAANPWSQIE